MEIAKKYIDKLPVKDNGLRVFTNHLSAYGKIVSKYSEKSGLQKIRIHDFRHSHASLLINSGVNIVAVSRRLGHENISTTLKTYTHLMDNTKQQLLDKIVDLSK